MRSLDKAIWKPFFDKLSRQFAVTRVEVSLDDLKLEEESEENPTQLLGLIYDPPGHTFDFSTMGIDHRIEDPDEIFVDEAEGLVVGVKVTHPSGSQSVSFSAGLKPPAL